MGPVESGFAPGAAEAIARIPDRLGESLAAVPAQPRGNSARIMGAVLQIGRVGLIEHVGIQSRRGERNQNEGRPFGRGRPSPFRGLQWSGLRARRRDLLTTGLSRFR